MKLSEVKSTLENLSELQFILPNGNMVPRHFHVTEIGSVDKHFIDCGGTIRTENKISFQLWEANDFDHRLAPQKLENIIGLSISALQLKDHEVEVEYQSETLGKYDLDFQNGQFHLIAQNTACLASDQCGAPKEKVNLQDLGQACCAPGSACC